MNTIEPTIGCETINTKVNFEYLIKTYLIKYNKTILKKREDIIDLLRYLVIELYAHRLLCKII